VSREAPLNAVPAAGQAGDAPAFTDVMARLRVPPPPRKAADPAGHCGKRAGDEVRVRFNVYASLRRPSVALSAESQSPAA
jgi:hypothetical protein